MKRAKHSSVLGLIAWFGFVWQALAADIIEVDMDLSTPGIQSTRVASPGESFQIGLVMTVDAAGVSSYGISALFDTAELSLTGSPAATNASPLPAGMSPLAAPVQSPPYVYTFNGATFGAGPTLTTFTLGRITYTVGTPGNDGLADITPGFFNASVDGMFDNGGNPVVPVFAAGFLMPRPLLRVALTSTNTVLIAWPAPSTGFSLQQNSTPGTTNWVSVTNTINVVGSEKQVIIAPPVGQKFYRLSNP